MSINMLQNFKEQIFCGYVNRVCLKRKALEKFYPIIHIDGRIESKKERKNKWTFYS
jgi:hypothetical protein